MVRRAISTSVGLLESRGTYERCSKLTFACERHDGGVCEVSDILKEMKTVNGQALRAARRPVGMRQVRTTISAGEERM